MSDIPPPLDQPDSDQDMRRGPLRTVLILIIIALLLVTFFYLVWPRINPGANTTDPTITSESTAATTPPPASSASTQEVTTELHTSDTAQETTGETTTAASTSETEKTSEPLILAHPPADLSKFDVWLQDQSRLFTTAEVNLRQAANTDSAIVGLLPYGAELETLSESDSEWKQVRYGELEGFVSADFVQLFPYGTTPQDRHYFTINDTSLIEAAGSSEAVLAEIPANTELTPLMVSKASPWMRVSVDGQEGYLDGADVNYVLGPSEGWQSTADISGTWDLRLFDIHGEDMIFGLWRMLTLEPDGSFALEDAYLQSEGLGADGTWSLEDGVLRMNFAETWDMGGTHEVPADEQAASYAIHLSTNGSSLVLSFVEDTDYLELTFSEANAAWNGPYVRGSD